MTDDTEPAATASLARALAQVNWAELEDAYGPAVDVPDQLLDLAEGGEHWEAALEALYAGVFHQGGCFSATPVAVRFLIDMLAADTAPKAAILKFLANLSMGHVGDVGVGFDPWVFSSSPPSADYPEGEATLRAVERGAASYVELLCHAEPEVRAAAAYVSGGVEPARASAAPLVLAQLSTEPHPEVLASLALCLSRAGEAHALSPLLTHSELVVRGAAAVGLVWVGGEVTEQVLATLVSAALGNQRFTVLPWGDEGSLATLAIAALSRARPPQAEAALWEVLSTRLARGERPIEFHPPSDPASRVAPPTAAEEVASAALRALAPAYSALAFPGLVERAEPALLSELSPHQRAVLRLTAASGLPLPLQAVPWMKPEALERFLADKTGPLERSLQLPGAAEADVTWRCLYRVADHRTPAEEVHRVLAAVNANCDPAEVLALCVDLLSGAYGHSAGAGLCFPFEKLGPLLARLETEAESLEAELLSLALNARTPDSRYAELLARPLFALARQRGGVLPEHLDGALKPAAYSRDKAWVRELLLSLPVARRSRWVGALRNAYTVKQYVELCDRAEVQRGVLQSLETWPLHREQARQLLVSLFSADELRDAITTRKMANAVEGDLAGSLLSEALASVSPELEYTLKVSRGAETLHCQLHSGAGAEELRGEVPANPKVQDIQALFGNVLPEVVRVQLAFDDHTLGYRLQRLLSELGVQQVHFGGSSLGRRR